MLLTYYYATLIYLEGRRERNKSQRKERTSFSLDIKTNTSPPARFPVMLETL